MVGYQHSFWTGGRHEVHKALERERDARLAEIRARMARAESNAEKAELEEEIWAVLAEYEDKARKLRYLIF